MYKVLHTFESQHDITYQNAEFVYTITNEDYISCDSMQSSLFLFTAKDSSIFYTLPVPVTCYKEKCSLILSICSLSKGGVNFLKKTDFHYKIKLNNDDTQVFYLPILPDFDQIQVNITGIESISSIEIIMVTEGSDYLIISNVGIYQPIFPFDIYEGLSKRLIMNLNSQHIDLGIVNGFKGDTTLILPEDIFIERYAVIWISSIAGIEIHQVKSVDETLIKFSDMYDGEQLRYTHTNATLKLYIPIVIGTSQREAIFPSITLWGSEPEPVPVNTDIENVIVAFGENEFKIQNQGECFKYNIIINCLARHDEVLQMLSTVVRHTLKQGIIWVNGLKLFIKQEGGAQQFDPNIPIEIEPQIQYRATIEIHEFVSEYKTLPTVKLINNKITIEEI